MNPAPNNLQRRFMPPSSPRTPNYGFKWSILAVPLAILAFFWLLNGLEPSFQFADILKYLHVVRQDKYVRLACLGVVLITATLIVKVVKDKSR